MSCKNAIAIFDDKNVKGNVHFHECYENEGIIVDFNLKGFKPNAIHAIHIHEFGDTTNGCESLGSHLNLTKNIHGSIEIDINKSHTGDLINNLKADRNGNFNFKYFDPRISISGNVFNSIIGCSVVIHEDQDDLGLGVGAKRKESLKSGNSGKRIACSVIGKAKDGKL
jgi:Cu-Zn family superoxide dismutase